MLSSMMMLTLNEDDRDFVTKIYEEYGEQMYRIALGILKNEQSAEEALQETMYKIIKYIDKFSLDDKFTARNKIMIGLRAAIHNTSCRQYANRKRKREQETDFFYTVDDEEKMIDIEDTTENVEERIIAEEDCHRIEKALLELSPELQDAINLVYYCDFSCVEAAEFLGISSSALRNRLYHARKKLKEALKGDFYEYDKK